jgi:hypothetical protein
LLDEEEMVDPSRGGIVWHLLIPCKGIEFLDGELHLKLDWFPPTRRVVEFGDPR